MIFEQASRSKIRFEVPQGLISVEDLWDLPLKSLDKLAIGLREQIRGESDSFLESTAKDKTTQLKFDIVKHILDVKVAERDAKALSRQRVQEAQSLKQIIAEKKHESLKSMSVEDLEKKLAELT